MSRIKWELEDLSLKVLDPIGYNEIVEGLKAQSEQHEEFLQGIQDRISTKLKESEHPQRDFGPRQAYLLDLPQNVCPAQDHQRDL